MKLWGYTLQYLSTHEHQIKQRCCLPLGLDRNHSTFRPTGDVYIVFLRCIAEQICGVLMRSNSIQTDSSMIDWPNTWSQIPLYSCPSMRVQGYAWASSSHITKFPFSSFDFSRSSPDSRWQRMHSRLTLAHLLSGLGARVWKRRRRYVRWRISHCMLREVCGWEWSAPTEMNEIRRSMVPCIWLGSGPTNLGCVLLYQYDIECIVLHHDLRPPS